MPEEDLQGEVQIRPLFLLHLPVDVETLLYVGALLLSAEAHLLQEEDHPLEAVHHLHHQGVSGPLPGDLLEDHGVVLFEDVLLLLLGVGLLAELEALQEGLQLVVGAVAPHFADLYIHVQGPCPQEEDEGHLGVGDHHRHPLHLLVHARDHEEFQGVAVPEGLYEEEAVAIAAAAVLLLASHRCLYGMKFIICFHQAICQSL